MTIRRATADDMDAMLGLLEELFSIEKDFCFEVERQRKALLLALQEEGCAIFVSEKNKKVVGMCMVQTLLSTAEGGPVGLVEDVVVSAAHRGSGIGGLLLEGAEEWARGKGLTRLQLLTDKGNKGAVEFYRKKGWSGTKLTCMRKFL